MESQEETRCKHAPQDGTLYTTSGLAASLSRRWDYPIDAMCISCGNPIRIDHPTDRWALKVYPEEKISFFKVRHPEVVIKTTVAGWSASWFDDDGPHEVTYISPRLFIDYLEAKFDR